METKNIYQKLLEAQKEIGAIKKDNDNPFFKSKYSDINAILAVVKPVLNKHGLILLQGLVTKDGKTGIETMVLDEYGAEIKAYVEIPTMAKPQETGSAITYFRRYALQSLLALEAKDDDGNEANKNTKVGDKKRPVDKFVAELDAMSGKVTADIL